MTPSASDVASPSQFSLPTNKTYDELIEKYNIHKMEGFIKYDDLKIELNTFNPQKVAGKPYKINGGERKIGGVYGDKITRSNRAYEDTDERFPRSVLKYHQNGEKLHPTQKPLEVRMVDKDLFE